MLPDSHEMLYIYLVQLGVGVSNRVFCTWFVWRAEPDGSYILAFKPADKTSGASFVGAESAQDAEETGLESIRRRRMGLETRLNEASTNEDPKAVLSDAIEIQKSIDELETLSASANIARTKVRPPVDV